MRVLLVDDGPEVRVTLEALLRDLGHEVLAVGEGKAALGAAGTFHPEAAVVDLGLPDIDGVTLAEFLRNVAGDLSIRLVALTGLGRDALDLAAESHVFDAFLTKPARLESIDRALNAG